MKADYTYKYHNIEEHHFWFKARRHFIKQLLSGYSKSISILDIGCGQGVLLNELKQSGYNNIFGIDIDKNAIDKCKESGLKNVLVLDAHNIIMDLKFDVIISSDCLEHLEHDELALKSWNSLLKENGKMLLFVPAFMSLWSSHDEDNMHFRRYGIKELSSKLEKNNFDIVRKSFWNFSLFFPTYFMRKISKLLSISPDELSAKPITNVLLFSLMKLENKILKTLNFPIGLSIFFIAKKKKNSEI